jgi:branched-subunit amino acid ABC-type transport system permease component
LYSGWSGIEWSGIGAWIFALAAAVSGLAGCGFNRLYQSMKKEGALDI